MSTLAGSSRGGGKLTKTRKKGGTEVDEGKKRRRAHRRVNNRVNILCWAEAEHNVIIHIHPQGVARCDGHIDPKIPRAPAPQTNLF